MTDDRYVCCGDIIPEGRMVCINCEESVYSKCTSCDCCERNERVCYTELDSSVDFVYTHNDKIKVVINNV